ncbi:MAG TPA: hypothetical protein EYP17_09220, partial [Candidatus Latescibacteria bacterium]|nr:hypothetical protein [Candidatus Latescibacterota bacterium]
MDVLIGFVTTSDPESPEGPAQIVTAAKALEPDYIHLLYTPLTEPNWEKTRQFLANDPQLQEAGTKIVSHKLDLPDARDYEHLKELIPDL